MTNLNQHKKVAFVISLIVLTVIGCNESVKRDFIANYQIDKVVPVDTTIQTRQKVDKTIGWTIYLGNENLFKIQKADKTIKGVWEWDKVEGDNQFIDFHFDNLHVSGRLNGNIIYFDKPNILLDSLFENAIFVKLKDKER